MALTPRCDELEDEVELASGEDVSETAEEDLRPERLGVDDKLIRERVWRRVRRIGEAEVGAGATSDSTELSEANHAFNSVVGLIDAERSDVFRKRELGSLPARSTSLETGVLPKEYCLA